MQVPFCANLPPISGAQDAGTTTLPDAAATHSIRDGEQRTAKERQHVNSLMATVWYATHYLSMN